MDLEQINILWKEMRAEVYETQAWAQAEPESDIRKRVFIRSMAAFCESCINSLSEAVVTAASDLSAAEYAILCETQFDLDDNGVIRERNRFYSAISRWRLLVRLMERRVGTSHWQVKFTDDGFNNFRKLFEIRNRIMHPKATNSMRIELDEIEACVSGYRWFVKNYQGLCKI